MSAETGTDLEQVTASPRSPIAAPQVTPEEAREANEALDRIIREVLREGQNGDYWQIPGTPQPTLLQPGAERLQRFFGLGRELSDPFLTTVTEDGKEFFACQIKCSITNSQGHILAESIGWCDDTEKKRNGPPGSKWKGNRNTIIQMATKRAYVNAIKTATNTSSKFTSDLEDSVAAAPAVKPAIEDRMTSDDEQRLLIKLFADKGGKTVEDAKAWLDSMGAKAGSRNWTAAQVLNLSLKPDAAKSESGDPEDVLPTVPELPVDPPADDPEPETVEAEVVDEDEAPF